MKKLVNIFGGVSLAVLMMFSLSGCENYNDISGEFSETASTVSASAVSLSETETMPQTSETELNEATTAAETEQSEVTQTEKKRETAVPAELDGDYIQWAQIAADTVYRFLEDSVYITNAPDYNRFGFADLNFDSVPEIIFFVGGMWGGGMTAYTLDGDKLYSYSTVYDNFESYIAATDSETGAKTMLFEAKGGHGFVVSHIVYALTDEALVFKEEWQYSDNRELYSYYAKVYSGEDEIEESDNGDELYRKYFGKYKELYRFDSELEMIEVPDRDNYTKDDVYACVSQVMKKYSENLPQN